jgi:hypothetical protein
VHLRLWHHNFKEVWKHSHSTKHAVPTAPAVESQSMLQCQSPWSWLRILNMHKSFGCEVLRPTRKSLRHVDSLGEDSRGTHKKGTQSERFASKVSSARGEKSLQKCAKVIRGRHFQRRAVKQPAPNESVVNLHALILRLTTDSVIAEEMMLDTISKPCWRLKVAE